MKVRNRHSGSVEFRLIAAESLFFAQKRGVLKMDSHNQIQTIERQQVDEQNNKKERVKATFSLLDRFVRVYNEGETYVKRGLTLFGLGSIIAGIAFGAGQQISTREADKSNNSVHSSTVEIQPTPQPVTNHNPSTPPPTVIYLAPHPNSHSSIPAHTSVPAPTPATITNPPVQTAPKSTSKPQPATATTNPEAKPVVSDLPIPKEPESISKVLNDVRQTVEPLQQVSGVLSGLKQTVEPRSEEGDDD